MKSLFCLILNIIVFQSLIINSMEEKSLDEKPGEYKQLTKSNIQRLYELSGHQDVPSLLFISELNYAKKSIGEINELEIPEDLKRSIIELKNKFEQLLVDLLNETELSQQNKNDIRLLINSGVNINSRSKSRGNRYNRTALMIAIIKKHTEMIEFLLSHGADVNARVYDGNTALIYAVTHEQIETVGLLLSKGANVDAKTIVDETPLMIASRGNNSEIVKLLLSEGADINAKDNDGYTALMFASLFGYPKIVKSLLSYGADINTEDKHGDSALTVAKAQGHSEIVKLLLNWAYKMKRYCGLKAAVSREILHSQNPTSLKLRRVIQPENQVLKYLVFWRRRIKNQNKSK